MDVSEGHTLVLAVCTMYDGQRTFKQIIIIILNDFNLSTPHIFEKGIRFRWFYRALSTPKCIRFRSERIGYENFANQNRRSTRNSNPQEKWFNCSLLAPKYLFRCNFLHLFLSNILFLYNDKIFLESCINHLHEHIRILAMQSCDN